MMDLFYARFGNLFLHLNQPWLSQANLVDFSQSIYRKRAALDNCWGFIDGTVWPVARPGEHQTVLFNGQFMPLNFKVLLHLMALLLTFLVLWIWSCGRKETWQWNAGNVWLAANVGNTLYNSNWPTSMFVWPPCISGKTPPTGTIERCCLNSTAATVQFVNE